MLSRSWTAQEKWPPEKAIWSQRLSFKYVLVVMVLQLPLGVQSPIANERPVSSRQTRVHISGNWSQAVRASVKRIISKDSAYILEKTDYFYVMLFIFGFGWSGQCFLTQNGSCVIPAFTRIRIFEKISRIREVMTISVKWSVISRIDLLIFHTNLHDLLFYKQGSLLIYLWVQ